MNQVLQYQLCTLREIAIAHHEFDIIANIYQSLEKDTEYLRHIDPSNGIRRYSVQQALACGVQSSILYTLLTFIVELLFGIQATYIIGFFTSLIIGSILHVMCIQTKRCDRECELYPLHIRDALNRLNIHETNYKIVMATSDVHTIREIFGDYFRFIDDDMVNELTKYASANPNRYSNIGQVLDDYVKDRAVPIGEVCKNETR